MSRLTVHGPRTAARPACKRRLGRTAPIAASIVGSALAGCTVGPDYREPRLATPPAYSESGTPALATNARADLSNWWAQFGDPVLDRLVDQALTGNFDLLTAASRIRAARENEIIAGAAALPQLQASGKVSNNRLSKNAGLSQITQAFEGAGGPSGGGATGLGLPGTVITTYAAGFDASWELDLFGQTRRKVEAAGRRSEAQLWSLRDTQVSVSAEVAADYLNLRSLQQQILLGRREAQRQQALLDLVKLRRDAGAAPDQDVDQQQTALSAALAATPPLEAEARGVQHALAVLLGQPPETLSLELTTGVSALQSPPTVPVGLPADLLRRRPDVRVAERNLAAATADIGVAEGAFYPQISLTGSADLASASLSSLISAQSIQTAASAAIVQTLFNGGRNRANLHMAREARQQAFYAYQKVVLDAFKDVEDALARVAADRRRDSQLEASLQSAQAGFDRAKDRFDAGLGDRTAVLGAEGALLAAQMQLAQSQGKSELDLVSLYKALGGGWSLPSRPS